MKVQAGTTIVGVEFDRYFKNKTGVMEPKFKIMFRIEIPKTQFTYVNAMNKIIELNDIYNFDWIAIDRGYGETQLELLHKYGAENPQTGLATKVVGYQFGEKVEVTDPYTYQKDRKPLKPFMVNNSVLMFEKDKMVFNPTDKKLIEQFQSYVVESISSSGMPIYSNENEHIIDAINLCLLIFQQKYGTLFKNLLSSKILSIKPLNRIGENVESRNINIPVVKTPSSVAILNFNKRNSIDNTFYTNNRADIFGSSNSYNSHSNRRRMFSRSMF